jgi:predicted phage terminase large subunit-like protein
MALSQNQPSLKLPERPATPQEIEELLLQEYLRRKSAAVAAQTFIDYVREVAPWVVIEETHVAIGEKLDEVVAGKIDRLMLFIAPRTGKSLFGSTLFPTYYIGHFSDRQIMQAGHSTNLAEGFGRDARNILLDEDYRRIFPNSQLSKDSRSTSSWATTAGGKYNAVGVGAGIAGKGFHLGIIDDPLSEQDAFSKTVKDGVWDWYGPGFYTRRMPGNNAIVLIMTRWAVDDLAGRLLAQAVIDPNADKWEVLSIPAILDDQAAALLTRISHEPKYRKYLSGPPITFKAGDSYSPRRWPLKELLRAKGQMTAKAWAALYQQSPYEDEGGILPRSQWKKWKKDEPPKCEYVMQVYDTAFEEEEVNDYSARTTWGIFRRPDDGKFACILLERYKKRVAFPELREEAWESYREYEPDRVFIEKKASGHSLIQELRRKGVPVSPVKVKDSKIARAHAASIVLEQGCVYYMERSWADEVMQQCAEFPNGKHDDLVDTCTMAWNLLRRMFWLQLSDEQDDDDPTEKVRERRRHWYLNK